jgi:hypothetical protein
MTGIEHFGFDFHYIDKSCVGKNKKGFRLKQQDSHGGYLPIHLELRGRHRSAILSKCIELYPEALAAADDIGCLPLHCLLGSMWSSLDDALLMIEKYPAASQHQNKFGELPLHIECKHQCRSSIISKCIELYPEALSKTDAVSDESLPLHIVLANTSSSIDDALMMIDKYPAALQHQSNYVYLPLHIECMTQCRSAIISKIIELYPEALAVPENDEELPLHALLKNENSSIDMALMMMKKYPAALQHANDDCELPIHIECKHQSRFEVIRRCLEIFPPSSTITINSHRNCQHDVPLEIVIQRILPMSVDDEEVDGIGHVYSILPVLTLLVKLNPVLLAECVPVPSSFENPDRVGIIIIDYYHLLLNLVPDDSTHSMSHDSLSLRKYLNWKSRSSLICILLKTRMNIWGMTKTSGRVNRIRHKGMKHLRCFLDQMIRLSSQINVDERKFALCQGDDLGDHLLRHILSYL